MYVFFAARTCTVQCLHGLCSAVHSMLIGYLPILLLFVYFLWFFSFLMAQTVKSVYWLESTSVTYVIECWN